METTTPSGYTLKPSYENAGYTLTLYRQSETHAWYRDEVNEISEIFEIRPYEAGSYTISGVTVDYDAGVSYPRDNHFDVWAWCSSVYTHSLQKWNELHMTKVMVSPT